MIAGHTMHLLPSIVVVLLVAALGHVHAAGQALRANDLVLEGLQGVGVEIAEVDPELVSHGVTAAHLVSQIDTCLRPAKIKLFSREERLKNPGMPHLYAKLTSTKTSEGNFVVHVRLSLREQARPVRATSSDAGAIEAELAEVLEQDESGTPVAKKVADFISSMQQTGPFAETWAAGDKMAAFAPHALIPGVSVLLKASANEFVRAWEATNP